MQAVCERDNELNIGIQAIETTPLSTEELKPNFNRDDIEW